MAIPDQARQRVLFRLGILARPGSSDRARLETFDRMAHLAEVAGVPVRDVNRILGLFSGSGGSGLLAGARAAALCGPRPGCIRCPVGGLCAYHDFGVRAGDSSCRGVIKDWNVEDRPRERLVRYGPEVLSEAELLAIILRSGTGVMSAVELARILLQKAGSLERLDQASIRDLTEFPGIGPAKAVEIKAALDLGKRVLRSPLAAGTRLTCSRDVVEAMKSKLAGQKREQFLLLALNTKNEILRDMTISIGNLSQSLVHPREVFREAIREAAACVMLVHNHPSGDPAPSRDDELITTRLCRAGELLGIKVLDHVIIGRDAYYSFADEGKLPPPGSVG
jgi:DNA repair protein RadC